MQRKIDIVAFYTIFSRILVMTQFFSRMLVVIVMTGASPAHRIMCTLCSANYHPANLQFCKCSSSPTASPEQETIVSCRCWTVWTLDKARCTMMGLNRMTSMVVSSYFTTAIQVPIPACGVCRIIVLRVIHSTPL